MQEFRYKNLPFFTAGAGYEGYRGALREIPSHGGAVIDGLVIRVGMNEEDAA